MKNIIKLAVATLILPAAMILTPHETSAQTVVKIGQAEIAIQSPISLRKKDTLEKIKGWSGDNEQHITKKAKYPRSFEDFHIGLSMAVPTNEEEFMPIKYGSSYNLEAGFKYFYRPGSRYAIGSLFQYTCNTFELIDAAQNETFVADVPGTVRREYYRTSNLGTGIINRFYFFPKSSKPFLLELGAYADYSFSKRYNVKTIENGEKNKYKYRDGSKFSPLHAGLYGAVGKGKYLLFARYRLTNLFYESASLPELPRFSIGIQITTD